MKNFATLNHSRHLMRMIIVTIFVLLIGSIAYFSLKKRFSSSQSTTSPVQSNNPGSGNTPNVVVTPFIFNPNKPWISFTQENVQTALAVNKEATFTVSGFSEGKNIEGYDILFLNDPERFEIISIESIHPSFQIYQFKKTTHITVTGVKQLTSTDPTVFDETPILKITIKPKVKGKIVIAFIDSVKKEQTKLVDTQVTVIKPQLQPLTVEIK